MFHKLLLRVIALIALGFGCLMAYCVGYTVYVATVYNAMSDGQIIGQAFVVIFGCASFGAAAAISDEVR
jgi:phage terminase small subunit